MAPLVIKAVNFDTQPDFNKNCLLRSFFGWNVLFIDSISEEFIRKPEYASM
jgi:hypothetical protein